MIEYLHFSNTKIFSSFWFPFLVSIYDRTMEILMTKNVECSERVSLHASVSLQSLLIFKELLLAVFYVSHRVWIVVQDETSGN